MRDENGDQRDHNTEYDEHSDQVTARVGAASFDEAHVMDENQRSESFRALKYRMLNDVQRPLPQANDRMALARRIGWAAPERGRISRCLVAHLAGFVTVGKRVQTLVLYGAHEKAIDLRSSPLRHKVGELIVHRVGNQLRARIEVIDPPTQRQAVDQWDQAISEQRQGNRQRRDKAQR